MPALTLANLGLYALQIAVVVAAAWAALAALRPGPRVRLAVLRLVLLAILLLPLQPTLLPVDGDPAMQEAGTIAAAAEALSVSPGPRSWPWRAWLAGVLAAGVAARAAWLLLGLVTLARVTRDTTPADDHPAVKELQLTLGTRARVCWHDGMRQAVTFGLRPAIVLLPASLRHEPEARLRAVACHELLHVQRRDWAVVLGEELVRTILWWHPAIWWLVDELQLTREQVIDRLTVDTLGGRRDYLDALLGTAAAPAALPLLSAFLRRRHLARRIAALAQEVIMSRSRAIATTVAAAIAVAGSSALAVHAWPLASPPQQAAGPAAAGQVQPGRVVVPAGPRLVARTPLPFPSAGANPDLEQVTITVLATVDAGGDVVEARLGGYQFRTKSGATAQFTGVPIGDSLRLIAPGASSPVDVAAVRDSVRALADVAIDGVGQWRVEPPVQAPATVEIAVGFEPSASRVLAAAGIVAVSGYGAMDRASASPTTRPATVQMALRVGGQITPPKKVVNVPPVYPEDAKAAGIQGVVILETTVDPAGVPSDVKVMRSVPGLDEAAADAVRQWRYEPTLLNGAPVPVIMTVTLNFTLAP